MVAGLRDGLTRWSRVDDATLGRALSIVAIVVLVAACIAYPIVSDETTHPLTVFAIPPVICMPLSSTRRTLLVAGGSIAAALVAGIWDDISAATFVARLSVIVAVSGLAVLGSVIRGRVQRRLGAALAAAQLHESFQRGLAPRVAPPPEVAVRTRFVAGEERMYLGGDFFDAVALPTGDLAFVVGDVAGHGPQQAAIGAAIRAGWKSAAFSAPAYPLEWIHLLATAFFEDRRFEEFVTMCTGRVEVATGRAELISAGHVWPVLMRETAELVPMIAGPPLGIDLPRGWQITEVSMKPGDALLVYTDGLTENRASSRAGHRWGEEGLIRWLAQGMANNPAWRPDLDTLLTRFSYNGVFADDVAVMLISAPQYPDVPETLSERDAATT
jgi:hypothetical protein